MECSAGFTSRRVVAKRARIAFTGSGVSEF
jgi:hypothetical protein